MDRVLELIQTGRFDGDVLFKGDTKKFQEIRTAIEDFRDNLPKETCAEFLVNHILPAAFSKDITEEERDHAIQIGFKLVEFVDISHLSPEKQEHTLSRIVDSYTKTIGDLRDNNSSSWYQLWILILRLCHTTFHIKMHLVNKLLRIVEVAFRNSGSINQRLQAYDCWVELINNWSLNMQHLCSPKQFKVIVTPLKAKFSRMPAVITKRFDTFVYLLNKLQGKVTLCLEEFLDFCFGPFDKNETDRMRQGKNIAEVCSQSTVVLMEVMGHCHEDQICLSCDSVKFEKPAITNENFPKFACILISSVIECCILLNVWNRDKSNNATIVQCLWGRILQLIKDSNEETREKCYVQVNHSLRMMLHNLKESEHTQIILTNIVDLTIKDEIIEHVKEAVFEAALDLVRRDCLDKSRFKLDKVLDFIYSSVECENASKFGRILSLYFKNHVKWADESLMCDIWLKCSTINAGTAVSNMIFAIKYYDTMSVSHSKQLHSKLEQFYTAECITDTIKSKLILEVEKMFQENPLMFSNVIWFLEFIVDVEKQMNKDLVVRLMKVIGVVLTLPNLPESGVTRLADLLLRFLEPSLPFYTKDGNEDTISNLSLCLEQLLIIHKHYSIIPKVIKCLSMASVQNLSKFARGMTPFLETLMLNEDYSVVTDVRKLMEALQYKSDLASSRTLKMINMSHKSPRPVRTSPTKLTPLKLFGKNLKNSSPLRGSQIGLSPISKRRLIVESPSSKRQRRSVSAVIDEDKSSDYVKVDTKVVFEPKKLSEHQKEMLQRRREDIPALYQDLSCQSQELTQSSSDTKEPATTESVVLKTQSDGNQDGAVEKTVGNDKNNLRETINEIIKSLSPPSAVEEAATSKVEEKAEEKSPLRRKSIRQSIKKNSVSINQEKVEQNGEKKKSRRRSSKSPKQRRLSLKQQPASMKASKSEMDVDNRKVDDSITELLEKIDKRIEAKKLERIADKCDVKSDVTNSSEDASPHLKSAKVNNRSKRSNKSESPLTEDVIEPTPIETGSVNKTETRSGEKDGNQNDSIVDLNESRLSDGANRRKSVRPRRHVYKPRTSLKSTNIAKVKKTQQDVYEFECDDPKQEVKGKSKSKRTTLAYRKLRRRDSKMNFHVTADFPAIKLCESNDLKVTPSKDDTSISLMISRTNDTQSPSDDGKKKAVMESEDIIESSQPKEIFADWKSGAIGAVENETKGSNKRKSRRPSKETDNLELTNIKSESNTVSNVSLSIFDNFKLGSVKGPCDISVENMEKCTFSPKSLGRNVSVRVLSFDNNTLPKESTIGDKLSDEIFSPIVVLEQTTLTDNPSKEEISKNDTVNLSPRTRRACKKQSPTSASPVGENLKVNQSLNEESSEKMALKNQVRRKTRSWPNIPVGPAKRKGSVPKRSMDKSQMKPSVVTPPETLTLEDTSIKDSSYGVVTRRRTRSTSLDKSTTNSEVKSSPPDTMTLHSEAMKSEDVQSETDIKVFADNCPDKVKEDLPGSPVNCDTPDRTVEFLNSTLDLSPISGDSAVTTPVPPRPVTPILRSTRLLQMVNNSIQINQRSPGRTGSLTMSPRRNRDVKKIRMQREENVEVLTFSREIPSPFTVPLSSILKRKILDDSPAPSPKRKRVNFSDPAITEKKIFIKDTYDGEDDGVVEEGIPEDIMKDFQSLLDKAKNKGISTGDLGRLFLDSVDKSEVVPLVKDFCGSSEVNLDCGEPKVKLQGLVKDLPKPEVVELFSGFLLELDRDIVQQINERVLENESQDDVDRCVQPLKNVENFKLLLTKLCLTEGQMDEFVKVFIEIVGKSKWKTSIVKNAVTDEEIQSYVEKYDSEKMTNLITQYYNRLSPKKASKFLTTLMEFSSKNLPVNKSFMEFHTSILQSFVHRMT